MNSSATQFQVNLMNCTLSNMNNALWRQSFKLLMASLICISLLPSFGQALSLADLFGGAALTVGSTRFTNWELVSIDNTAAQLPQLSQIIVNPMIADATRPGISYTTNGQLTATGLNAIDFTFRYRVQALYGSKSYVNQSLALNGVTFGNTSEIALVSQEVADLSAVNLGATLVMVDKGSNFLQSLDEEAHLFRFKTTVTTNIFLTGLAAGDSVSLDGFIQQFTQTGPQSLAGDFDVDGDVDGHDLLIWQRGGSPVPKSSNDLSAWRSNYGNIVSFVAATIAVPEPTGVVTLLIGWTVLAIGRPTKKPGHH
jgi:hypothetical protein